MTVFCLFVEKKMNATDIGLLIAGYFLILIVISLLTGQKSDNETFFTGNRKSPWYVVSVGMVGASLSGVTFISVPGWVNASQFTYLQMVLGFVLGYFVIANLLLPLYYRLNLTSIYTYLENRFGEWTYQSGSLLFIVSRTVGASARLYLMASVLQLAVADAFNIPFAVTVFATICLIWLYTFRSGIKTIIWTDTLQTLLLITAVVVTIYYISGELNLNFKNLVSTISESAYSKIWIWNDWAAPNHFLKQFFAGMFTTIVMTGLDQDMMQKNLTCKNLKEAKKNMYWYGFAFLPVNLLFLSLGALLFIYAAHIGMELPARADDLYPTLALNGYLPASVSVFFILGLVAAAYSSADSALTSLTTSFSLDILKVAKMTEKQARRTRYKVHIGFSLLIGIIIIVFRMLNRDSIIDTIYILAGYTYGPLLGLFAFGLFTKFQIKDKWVPLVVIIPPLITGILDYNAQNWFGFSFGYEKLMLNGLITFIMLLLIKKKS